MQLIDQYSDIVSVMCNRVFARERVRETWRDLESRRLFLSHWPVKDGDIELVESPVGSVLDPGAYELEERSGKVSIFNGITEPISITYTGGFELPDDAPDALKQAAILLVRTARTQAAREATSGIRSISHKDARVMFFDPNQASRGQVTTTTSGGTDAVKALLYHYTRLEI
jgi:hypothetical protein